MDAPVKFGGEAGARIGQEAPEQTITISDLIEQLTGFVRRQYPIFIFFIACSLALGAVYLFTTPPRFTAHTMLLIDSSKLRFLQTQETPLGDIPIDTAQVETQVEILKSENIGLSVVKNLKLIDDPEFTAPRGGLIGKIMSFLPSSAVKSDTALTRSALATFLADRTISRVGRTYVLDIGFTSLNPTRAAAVANAIADAYILDQLESKYQATKRASGWLQDRIKELRRQATDADRAVLNYKEKNNIVSVGGNSSGGPRLLGEQQLEDLNTQLGTARAAAEEAKARLDRIDEVLNKDAPDASLDATVTDSLHSEVINHLRTNYLELASREAIWSARYGRNHLAVVNLRTQMAQLRKSIFDELQRIAQGYKSDYEIAKSHVDLLESELQKLVVLSQATNRDRLGLTDLESNAKVYHSIYSNFLQRYMEAIQQESFPITEARVIGAAAPPEGKSGPLTLTVLGIALFIGIVLSFAAAVLREAIDQVFRTARHVESALNVNCLAALPRLGGNAGTAAWSGSGGLVPRPKPALAKWKNAPENVDPSRTVGATVLAREVSNGTTTIGVHQVSAERKLKFSKNEFMREVVDEPLSGFAEAFRSIKVAADIGGSNRNHQLIGITSTLPGEGKSTVASNLAELIAHSGKRVILLDGDLRNPTLTRALAPDSKSGLLEVVKGELTIKEVAYFDDQTGLSFIPTKLKSRLFHTNEVLASPQFKSLVDDLRTAYDYVIIDLPPLAPVVDVRATTRIVDSYIYVIEWGKTRKNLVQQQLLNAPEVYDLLLGVVLNKADVRVMGRYEDYYGGYYAKRYYSRYGYTG